MIDRMKIKKIILIMIFAIIFIPTYSLASNNMLETTGEALDISSFISEASKYTEEVFQDMDFSEILNQAIEGEVEKNNFVQKILSLFGNEITSQIKIIGSIILIIVIHSILKSVSDGLENGRN